MDSTIYKIQDYQRLLVSLECKEIYTHEFTVYLHESDSQPNSNFAIPNTQRISNIRENLQTLRKIFESRGRKPRIEFLVEYSPSLIKKLPSNNFFEEMRAPLVYCRPETFRGVKPIFITVERITNQSPLSTIKDILTIQQECFGRSAPLTEESIIDYRESLTLSPFLAILEGRPVAIVFLGPVYDGVSEVFGLATLPSFRQQGIATSLLSEVFRRAFNEGIDLLFASAGSKYSFKALTKIGSFPCATLVGYGYRSDKKTEFHNSVGSVIT